MKANPQPLVWLALLLSLGVLFACDTESDDSTNDGATTDDDTSPSDDDNDNDDESPAPEITLPPFPFWPNEALTIDLDHVTAMAADYCARHPADWSAAGFFLNDLPLHAFDLQFCHGDDCVPSESLFGDLYLSGYFGGVWLRGLLSSADSVDDFEALRPIFDALTAYAADVLLAVREASDSAVVDGARSRVTPLLLLYAYNLGYLQQILAEPPPGIEPPADLLVCDDGLLLDCAAPPTAWPFLDRYEASLDLLRDPPNQRWTEMRAVMDQAAAFAAWGAWVWRFLDISGLSEAAYRQLLDLSVDFLLAGKTAALGHMTAWASRRPAEGRFALLTDGGMIVWSGSYFMGLASPGDEFPTLVCP